MNDKKMGYYFEPVGTCEMCGDSTEKHKILGQRLNTSQGLRPKKKSGISVSVKKCNNCQLVYSSPQPIPINFQDHYGVPPEDYWIPEYFNWTPAYFADEVKKLNELMEIKKGMKSLDVGAGIGKCMLSMQSAGFDTYGFEPSETFHQMAISKMNIPPEHLKLGMIEDMHYPENSFDFITFGAVFEHLYHPSIALSKVLTWLKPGGIVHIEVPSSKYLVTKLYNIYYKLIGTNYVSNISPMYEPFHTYEFGYRSFQELGKRIGFKIVFHEYNVCSLTAFHKIFHPFLKRYMKWTDTGMQLIVWLSK